MLLIYIGQLIFPIFILFLTYLKIFKFMYFALKYYLNTTEVLGWDLKIVILNVYL